MYCTHLSMCVIYIKHYPCIWFDYYGLRTACTLSSKFLACISLQWWVLTDGGSFIQTLPSWGGINKACERKRCDYRFISITLLFCRSSMGIQRPVILEDEQINDEEYVAFVNVTALKERKKDALTHLAPIHLRHSEASIIICHGTSWP